jgi:hypothetical protein
MSDVRAHDGFDIYRPLSGVDLYLSKYGLFGFFNARRKLLVENHAFKCWFLLKSLKPQYLNIKIAADSADMVREAMQVRVKYFNWRMKEIDGAYEFTRGRRGSRKRLSYFFADPVESVKRQRLWLRPPTGAKFVMLTFERGDYTSTLGFSSKIKLKLFDENTSFQNLSEAFLKIMVSRDRMRMTWFVDRLKHEAMTFYQAQKNTLEAESSPIEMARQMLSEMVYLWHGVEEKRALMVVDDAAHLARNGFTLDRRVHDQLSFADLHQPEQCKGGDSDHCFEYGSILIHEWIRSGLMSSQMRLEAMHLIQAVKTEGPRHIVVREGRQFLARLMVALAVTKQTGWPLTIDVSETLFSEQSIGEWYRWRSLLEWISFAGFLETFAMNVQFLVKDSDQRDALKAVVDKQQIAISLKV